MNSHTTSSFLLVSSHSKSAQMMKILPRARFLNTFCSMRVHVNYLPHYSAAARGSFPQGDCSEFSIFTTRSVCAREELCALNNKKRVTRWNNIIAHEANVGRVEIIQSKRNSKLYALSQCRGYKTFYIDPILLNDFARTRTKILLWHETNRKMKIHNHFLSTFNEYFMQMNELRARALCFIFIERA